jgi:hydroxymethylbilane synthase
VRIDDARTRECLLGLNDVPTMIAVQAERAFLAAMDGGCQVPIGALVIGAGGEIGTHGGDGANPATLYGFIADPAGRRVIRGSRRLADDPFACGRALATDLRERGADEILAVLRGLPRVVAPQPE